MFHLKKKKKRFFSGRKSEKNLAYGPDVGGIIIRDPSLASQCLSLDPETFLCGQLPCFQWV